MPRRSNRQVAKILSSAAANREDPSLAELDRKVTLATEGFTTTKFCELNLMYWNYRLVKRPFFHWASNKHSISFIARST
jgi:hypothetical protein